MVKYSQKFNRFLLKLFIVLHPFLALADSVFHKEGKWEVLSKTIPFNPISLTLMHNGKVLILSGSGNSYLNTEYKAGIWDPKTGDTSVKYLKWDIFCAVVTVLPDGRPFFAGGSLIYDSPDVPGGDENPFAGDSRSAAYDPQTDQFVELQKMAHGRWYATIILLNDGKALIFSGEDENTDINNTLELYKVGYGWEKPIQAQWFPPEFPWLFQLPNGKIFYAGNTTRSRFFDLKTKIWTNNVAFTTHRDIRKYGSPVLLTLKPEDNYKPQIILFGGGYPEGTDSTDIIDLSEKKLKWRKGPTMAQARVQMDAVLLPDGKVFVVNGSKLWEDVKAPSLKGELYDPQTNSFSPAGSTKYAHLYHSNALLLPDGKVVVMGGNPIRDSYENHIEIYYPPYLFNSEGKLAKRPIIKNLNNKILGYDKNFTVNTEEPNSIKKVVLMHPGAVTHAYDMNQRSIELAFNKEKNGLVVKTPPNDNIAPPGYYMLFLINSAGVPSEGEFVQLSSMPDHKPPRGKITKPAKDIKISCNETVDFEASADIPESQIAHYSWVFPEANPETSDKAAPKNIKFYSGGDYLVSLTVTDKLGATDPSPPTRTISVVPCYHLSVFPPLVKTKAGEKVSVKVEIIRNEGFDKPITLDLSPLPGFTEVVYHPSDLATNTNTIDIITSPTTPAATYNLVLKGISEKEIEKSSFKLVVEPAEDHTQQINKHRTHGG